MRVPGADVLNGPGGRESGAGSVNAPCSHARRPTLVADARHAGHHHRKLAQGWSLGLGLDTSTLCSATQQQLIDGAAGLVQGARAARARRRPRPAIDHDHDQRQTSLPPRTAARAPLQAAPHTPPTAPASW